MLTSIQNGGPTGAKGGKKAGNEVPQEQWRSVGALRYPWVQSRKGALVPIKGLAKSIGCTAGALHSALQELPRMLVANEVKYRRDDGRLVSSPAVLEHSIDYLLYSFAGRRGVATVRALRREARSLSFAALIAQAPPVDQAVVMYKVLEYKLEIEQQKVADRDRQIADLKRTKPGAALVNARWCKQAMATKEALLRVAALERDGKTLELIAQQTGLSLGVIKAFLSGTYKTTGAAAAYADLQKAGFSLPAAIAKMAGAGSVIDFNTYQSRERGAEVSG